MKQSVLVSYGKLRAVNDSSKVCFFCIRMKFSDISTAVMSFSKLVLMIFSQRSPLYKFILVLRETIVLLFILTKIKFVCKKPN